jgi:hypothetical protein
VSPVEKAEARKNNVPNAAMIEYAEANNYGQIEKETKRHHSVKENKHGNIELNNIRGIGKAVDLSNVSNHQW